MIAPVGQASWQGASRQCLHWSERKSQRPSGLLARIWGISAGRRLFSPFLAGKRLINFTCHQFRAERLLEKGQLGATDRAILAYSGRYFCPAQSTTFICGAAAQDILYPRHSTPPCILFHYTLFKQLYACDKLPKQFQIALQFIFNLYFCQFRHVLSCKQLTMRRTSELIIDNYVKLIIIF